MRLFSALPRRKYFSRRWDFSRRATSRVLLRDIVRRTTVRENVREKERILWSVRLNVQRDARRHTRRFLSESPCSLYVLTIDYAIDDWESSPSCKLEDTFTVENVILLRGEFISISSYITRDPRWSSHRGAQISHRRVYLSPRPRDCWLILTFVGISRSLTKDMGHNS